MPIVLPSEVVTFIERWLGSDYLNANPEEARFAGTASGPFSIIVKMVASVPEELLLVDRDEYCSLLAARACMSDMIERWKTHPNERHGTVPTYETSAPKLIWAVLRACPDEATALQESTVDFIDDESLRLSVARDIRAAYSALANHEYKSATVLSGAVCEAMALYTLQQPHLFARLADFEQRPQHPNSLEHWPLSTLNDALRHVRAINEHTHTQVELARNFRNLIHPGREIRTGVRCDRGTSYGALAGVELLATDLRRSLGADEEREEQAEQIL